MTIQTLRLLVLGEAVAIVALAVAVIWLAWTLHGCLKTVRRLHVPSWPGDVQPCASSPEQRRDRGGW